MKLNHNIYTEENWLKYLLRIEIVWISIKVSKPGGNTRIIAGFVEKSYGVFRHTQRNFEFWIFYPSNPCKIAKKKFRKPEHRFSKLKDILGKK